ncbi:MAG: hypothetical protein M3203_13085 [Actinomycetota bacterium]|nr:hypothetical protein [Actinomycetota bacterium]
MTSTQSEWGRRLADAAVSVQGRRIALCPGQPFFFGRDDRDGVVGLDPDDMGISAVAGSVEWDLGLWWVVNRSGKRPLLLDDGGGGVPQTLRCGQRHAVNVRRLSVLVRGAIRTHPITVEVPPEELACVPTTKGSSGTLTFDIDLSDRDRDVLVAMASGYLRDFPFNDPRPRTYREVADILGPPWNKTKARRQVDRVKERLARENLYFDGPHANYDLIEYLITNGIIGPSDLSRLPGNG